MPEVRRLWLAHAAPPDQQAQGRHWSSFRRAHQATAKRCHQARRAQRHSQLAHTHPCLPGDVVPCPVLPVPGTAPLTAAAWALIAPVLPPAQPARGRSRYAHRPLLEGMLWVMQTGRPWRDLPTHFGPWHTVYSRYQRWCQDGLWARICAILHPPAPPAPAPP